MPIHSHWAVTQVHRKHTNMTNMHFQRQITAPRASMCTRKMAQWMQHNIGNTPALVRSHGDSCIMAKLPFQPSLDHCFSLVIFLDHHSLPHALPAHISYYLITPYILSLLPCLTHHESPPRCRPLSMTHVRHVNPAPLLRPIPQSEF